MKLKEAKALAIEARNKVAKDEDPAGARPECRQGEMFEGLAGRWLAFKERQDHLLYEVGRGWWSQIEAVIRHAVLRHLVIFAMPPAIMNAQQKWRWEAGRLEIRDGLRLARQQCKRSPATRWIGISASKLGLSKGLVVRIDAIMGLPVAETAVS